MEGRYNEVLLYIYSKTCVKQPLPKRPRIGFQDQLSLNAGQKYCRMLQGVRSSELLAKLQLADLDLILRERRLRWFGHVARSSGAIRTAYDMQIDGKRGAGRPKQTWKKLTEKDCREWKLTTVDPQERSTWRSGVRSAMRAASQLPGKGPTDVDDAPAPAR